LWVLLIASVLSSLVDLPSRHVEAAGCHGSADYGPPNNYPIIPAEANQQLIKTVKNGKMYLVTVPNDGGESQSNFTVLHVWGSAYEMGYAQGLLVPQEANEFINRVWAYFQAQVDQVISSVPTWLANLIADIGLDAALDWTYYMTVEYTPSHFYDEIRGLVDAAGGDYNTVVRVHMIAGLTQGDCSMFGAWGQALPSNTGTNLLQLRALDWNMDGPFRDYSSITVYHPTDGDGHAFMNIAFLGFVGGLTGVSSTQLGISEIGVAYPDSTFGSESRIGLPFIFLLRDILQYDNTVDDATNRMINARRTCDLILGVGDGKMSEFRGYQYSYSVLNVMDDENMMPNNTQWHPRITNTVYWGMDWDCPAYNTILSTLLNKYHGQITPQLAVQEITAVEKSGDNHIAFYDLTQMQVYVSFAAPFGVGGQVPAYARQFVQFDANKLFAEQPPSF